MDKLVAVLGGSDWYDASVEFLTVPKDFDEKQARSDYGKWLEDFRAGKVKYLTFAQWLCKQGAKEAGEDKIEVWED